MKECVFPLRLVVGPHENSRLGVVEAGRVEDFFAWLRVRAVRLRAEKKGGAR